MCASGVASSLAAWCGLKYCRPVADLGFFSHGRGWNTLPLTSLLFRPGHSMSNQPELIKLDTRPSHILHKNYHMHWNVSLAYVQNFSFLSCILAEIMSFLQGWCQPVRVSRSIFQRFQTQISQPFVDHMCLYFVCCLTAAQSIRILCYFCPVLCNLRSGICLE